MRRILPWIAIVMVLVGTAYILRSQGRLWRCSCDYLLIWSGSLELGQLPAPVGPIQLHAPAPRLPIVWIACADRPTAVGRLAAVACSFDRGCVGSNRELGVRYSAIPGTDRRARLPRRHDRELAWGHPRLRARVHDGQPSRLSSHSRAVCADGGCASPLDQR